MMDDGCFFPFFFSCFYWMSQSTRSILIPHTPLYPIYQLSLETNRHTVLFMTIDTFFCLCLRTFLCRFLCCMTANADQVQQCCWTAKHVPVVREGLGLRRWAGAKEAMRTAVLDERPMEAVTAR